MGSSKKMIQTVSGNQVEVEVYELKGSNKIQQWQIRYCDLGEADVDNKECGKSRPCIICQTNAYNMDDEATIYILPLSTSPMYNITSEKLIGIQIGNNVSIICFNELRSIHRNKIQNNIIADTIPENVKNYIIEYYMQRLFGMAASIDNIDTIAQPKTEEVTAQPQTDLKDARALSLLDWMLCNDFIINPQNIGTGLSLENCGYLYRYYEKYGSEPFSGTKGFNDKTFKLAMRAAKRRIENSPYAS